MISILLESVPIALATLFIIAIVPSDGLTEASHQRYLQGGGSGCTPSVGIDLSTDYGTVSAIDCNGKTHDIYHVTTPDYQAMTARLSLEESEHLHPPYSNIAEELRDKPRQLAREARKKAGLPASDDVETLATLLLLLYTEAEAYLGTSINDVFPLTPHLRALYDEDLSDALDYLGLRSPRQSYPVHYDQTQESCGAFAGHGLGICKTYWDHPTCEEEKKSLTTYRIMVVSYTQHAFTASLSTADQALYAQGFTYMNAEDFRLGSSAPQNDAHWAGIRAQIRDIWASDSARKDVQKLILIGESAKDERFVSVVKDTFDALQGTMPEILGDEPLFVAARGAAQLMLRERYKETARGDGGGEDGQSPLGLVRQGDL